MSACETFYASLGSAVASDFQFSIGIDNAASRHVHRRFIGASENFITPPNQVVPGVSQYITNPALLWLSAGFFYGKSMTEILKCEMLSTFKVAQC